MIISTTLIPREFNALTIWPFMFIRQGHSGDAALIAHEMAHYREQRNCGVLPWLLLYWLSKRFRIAAEVRGYRAQIAAGGITVDQAAQYLVQYGAGITLDRAKELLS